MDGKSKQELVQIAFLSDQAGRYDDMAAAMKKVVELGVVLSSGERDLLSSAYKCAICHRRTAWHAISAATNINKGGGGSIELVREYRAKIEAELRTICNEVLALVDKYLMPKAATPDAEVFFLKMRADYWRYLAEVAANPNEHYVVARHSYKAYEQALDIAMDRLHPASPLRLSIALNFSVFLHEIMNWPNRACQLAKDAFIEAKQELNALDNEGFANCTMIMKLLRENLIQWMTPGKEQQQDGTTTANEAGGDDGKCEQSESSNDSE